METNDVKEKLSAGKDKVNAGINGLPFKGILEKKVPQETREKFPVLNKVIPLANYIFCALVLVIVVVVIASIAGGGGSSVAHVNFGGYPADYGIAYFNMVGISKAPTVRELFGPDAAFATSFMGASSKVTMESGAGAKDEFEATLLLSIQNPNTNENMKAMRLQVKFEADSMTERSYVRYIRVGELISGQITERQSSGSAMQDAEIFGMFFGMLEYFWNLDLQ